MGLTIHYSLSLPGKTPADVVHAKLERLRQRCLDLPVAEVDDTLADLKGKQCGSECIVSSVGIEDPAELNLFRLICRAGLPIEYYYDEFCRPQIYSSYAPSTPYSRRVFRRKVQPKRMIGFTVIPGPGCEPLRLGQATYPKNILIEPVDSHRSRPLRWSLTLKPGEYCPWLMPHRLRLPAKNTEHWTWSAFCKTQYASHPGEGGSLENFLRCHLSVIAILDYARKLGFETEVSDEGKFWLKRDIKTLCEKLNEYNEMAAGFGGILKDAAASDKGGKIEGAIFGNPDFERLEAKGRAKINPKLAKLIRQVARYRK